MTDNKSIMTVTEFKIGLSQWLRVEVRRRQASADRRETKARKAIGDNLVKPLVSRIEALEQQIQGKSG